MNKIFNLLLILNSFSFSNCSNDDDLNLDYTNLKSMEIGDYSLQISSQFKLIEEQEIDSYVGKIVGSGIELSFDFGVYTAPYENLPEDKFELIIETSGSVERQIVVGKIPEESFTAIHIRDLNNFSALGNYVSLRMSTVNISQEQQNLIVKILKSVTLIE